MNVKQKTSITDFLTSKIEKTVTLGNSDLGDKEFCSDLINSYVRSSDDWERLAEGTFLSVSTLRRMSTLKDAESGEEYSPKNDTCERILRYFGCEAHYRRVSIKAKYANKPKI